MNRLREIKWGLAAGLAVITGLLGDLAMPVLVLVLLNGLDYGTGLLAALSGISGSVPIKGCGALPKRYLCGCWSALGLW